MKSCKPPLRSKRPIKMCAKESTVPYLIKESNESNFTTGTLTLCKILLSSWLSKERLMPDAMIAANVTS